MQPYEQLISILDVFIDEFGGDLRMRAVKAAFVIQKASVGGTGISPSALAREIEAPLENVRRHVGKQVEIGILDHVLDPDDERAAPILLTPQEAMQAALRRMTGRLAAIGLNLGCCHQAEHGPMEACDRLMSVLGAYIDEFGGGMRIRGVKTALLIQRETIEGRGISVSEIARHSGAPLESVRRHIGQHVASGTLRYVPDPEDERVNRVKTTDPDEEGRRAARIASRLSEQEQRA
jgi:hypothetical protein